jgi:hypothetical protein
MTNEQARVREERHLDCEEWTSLVGVVEYRQVEHRVTRLFVHVLYRDRLGVSRELHDGQRASEGLRGAGRTVQPEDHTGARRQVLSSCRGRCPTSSGIGVTIVRGRFQAVGARMPRRPSRAEAHRDPLPVKGCLTHTSIIFVGRVRRGRPRVNDGKYKRSADCKITWRRRVSLVRPVTMAP